MASPSDLVDTLQRRVDAGYRAPAGELSGYSTYRSEKPSKGIQDSSGDTIHHPPGESPKSDRERAKPQRTDTKENLKKTPPGNTVYNAPGPSEPGQKIHVRTPGTPGEEYGHPFKENVYPRRTDDATPGSRSAGNLFPSYSEKQHEQMGKAKLYSQKYYRTNRGKIRSRAKRDYLHKKNNQQFKLEKKRRNSVQYGWRFERLQAGGYRSNAERAKEYREKKADAVIPFFHPNYGVGQVLDISDGDVWIRQTDAMGGEPLGEGTVPFFTFLRGVQFDTEGAIDAFFDLADSAFGVEPSPERVATFYRETFRPGRNMDPGPGAQDLGEPSPVNPSLPYYDIEHDKRKPGEVMNNISPTDNNPGSAKVIPEGHDFANRMAGTTNIDPNWVKGIRAWVKATFELKSHYGSMDDLIKHLKYLRAGGIDKLWEYLFYTKGLLPRGLSWEGSIIEKLRVKIDEEIKAAARLLDDEISRVMATRDAMTPGTVSYNLDQRQGPKWSVMGFYQRINPDDPKGAALVNLLPVTREVLAKVEDILSGKLLRAITAFLGKYSDSQPFENEEILLEYNIGRMKLVHNGGTDVFDRSQTRPDPADPRDLTKYIPYFQDAKALLDRRGFGGLWYGPVFINCPKCGGINPNGAHFGVGAHYWANHDHITMYQEPGPGITPLLIHELGHRYYFKFMDSGDRARFDSYFKEVAATSDYGATNPRDDFAEVFKDFVLGRDMTRDQIERFKAFLAGKDKGRFAAARSELTRRIEAVRPALARAAQNEYDQWDQDEEGLDEVCGAGGICDRIADAFGYVLNRLPGVDVMTGGQDGDDHAYIVAYTDTEAVSVDIPPGVYETGGGYTWKKRPGVRFSPSDVVIEVLGRRDIDDRYASSVRVAAKAADILKGLDPGIRTRSKKVFPKLVGTKGAVSTFHVPGSDGTYTVKVKGQPGEDLQVSCSCGFWQFQGPEYWAKAGGYLLGKPRGEATKPSEKDPKGRNRICKHVLAAMNILKG
jgi:hypothetical protein